jgi:hypothetical protein
MAKLFYTNIFTMAEGGTVPGKFHFILVESLQTGKPSEKRYKKDKT